MYPKNIFQFILFFFISILLCSPFVYVLNTYVENQNLRAMLFLFVVFATFIGLLTFINRNKKTNFEFKPLYYKHVFFSVLLIWIIQSLLFVPFFSVLFKMEGEIVMDVYILLGSLVFAPILEELVFRNILLKSLLISTNKNVAIFFSAALFGLIHFIPAKVFSAFFIGLIISYFYNLNRNILHSILLHFSSNLFVLVCNLIVFRSKGISEFYCVNLFICFLLVLFLKYKFKKLI